MALKRMERLPLVTCLAAVKQLLQGVAPMHSRNLDRNPGNVLLRKRVSNDGRWQDVSIALGDLGLVRFVGERVGGPVGIPVYMAPEVDVQAAFQDLPARGAWPKKCPVRAGWHQQPHSKPTTFGALGLCF
jgi:hypothetical protein